ncbi:MAG: DUF1844 domain-containing protein [Acidobacteriota bacterium]
MSDAEIPSARQPAEAEEELPLPPPSFEYLTISLRMQVEAHLGLLHFGEEKPPKPDFRAARHAIDLLAMLEQKTRGNLSLEEQRLLANSLTELRFRYVQALEESRKKE